MINFDWDKFLNKNNRIAVHCKTEEEAREFCTEMHNHGLQWCSGRSYQKVHYWGEHKGNTCYTNDGYYGAVGYFKTDHNFGTWTVLEYDDYTDEFKVETIEQFIQRTGRNVEF